MLSELRCDVFITIAPAKVPRFCACFVLDAILVHLKSVEQMFEICFVAEKLAIASFLFRVFLLVQTLEIPEVEDLGGSPVHCCVSNYDHVSVISKLFFELIRLDVGDSYS